MSMFVSHIFLYSSRKQWGSWNNLCEYKKQFLSDRDRRGFETEASVKTSGVKEFCSGYDGYEMTEFCLLRQSVSSVVQSCLTPCDPMNRSTPGLPVHHQLPEFTQTPVHRVGDAIQPSHPLSSPSPPDPNPSQRQSFPMSQLFEWGGQSTGVSALASFLPKKSQGWSPLECIGWISLQSKGLSRVFSNTTVQKHQFSALSFLHSPTLTSIYDHWKNHSLDQMDLCWQSNVSAFEYTI